MSWQSLFKNKLTTADTAVESIQTGDRVFLTGNTSVPQELLTALVRRSPEIYDVELCQALTIGEKALYTMPEMRRHLRVNAMFIGHQIREAVNEGRADFTPVFLSEFPLLFKNHRLPLDVALVHLSPPDEHGFCSYGLEVGLTKSSAESARIIIAEVNQQMPRTLGDSFIHVSRLTHIVPVDYPLVEYKMSEEGDAELATRIAGRIADLIPDGATMQLGIGPIPEAVLGFLRHKRDLGIHTELFSDGVIDLVDAGVITNARKTLHAGKIVAGFIMGTKRLYDFVHNNPIIELHPTEYVNDPFVIAQNYRQIAINSAIEIDLTGQVCADSIGTHLYSGVGGLLDFVYGASRSEEGVPIIALPSSAIGEEVSRIVPTLKPGAGVVITRNHVHYVVTEFGVASLYGRTIRQRAQELINVAHPKFRDELTAAARELHYLP
jgi:4-hydroxybutyrate CoA-transferase